MHTPDERTAPFARVVSEPIDLDALRAIVDDARMGAVVTFEGVVRNHDHGEPVSWLHYTSHPSANDAIVEAARAIADEFPTVSIAVEHRIGDLTVGDVALGCAVASAHRAEAFAACSQLVDRVKETVPIWKEQGFEGGGSEWVGSTATDLPESTDSSDSGGARLT